jgi:predicted double-glycine peptidase
MKKSVLLFLILSGLSGCSGNKSKILDFPAIRQSYEYSCGPGAVQAVLAYYGEDFRESQLIDLLKTDKNDGTYVKDIVKFINSRGLLTDVKQYMTKGELLEYIDKNIPVIVLIQAWGNLDNFNNHYKDCWNDGHFVVVIGYTDKDIICSDPALFKYGYIPVQEFMERWHDYDEGETKTYQMGIAVHGKDAKFVHDEFERIK